MPSNTSDPVKIDAHCAPRATAHARLGVFLALLICLSTSAGIIAWKIGERAFHAPRNFPGGVVVITSGSSLETISRQLYQGGFIDAPLLFRIFVVIHGMQQKLQAGEFSIPTNASMAQVAEILSFGRSIQHRITLPEGITSAEVVNLLERTSGLEGEIGSIPDEGTLLPETYYFERGSKRTELVERMTREARKVLTRLWDERSPDLPLRTPEEALILASIVEKETSLERERPLIAAVFLNRLAKGMRLQADPSVIYGLTLGVAPLGRPLLRSDLKHDTPYNTYRRDGLPPTPICNPGKASIKSVLNPLKSQLLYFVADGSGGHRFAATFSQHRSNVAAWREFSK